MTTGGSATAPSRVGHDFALEAPLLRPLPAEAFETGLTLTPRVDRYARVTVRQCLLLGARPVHRRSGPGPARAPIEVLVFDGATGRGPARAVPGPRRAESWSWTTTWRC